MGPKRRHSALSQKRFPQRIAFLLLAVFLFGGGLGSFTVLSNRNVDYLYDIKLAGIEKPIGYNLAAPTFSWKIRGTNGAKTRWAHIAIHENDSKEPVLEKRVEGNTNHISFDYESEFLPVLKPRTRYTYTIETVDENGKKLRSDTEFFETGKLGEAWSGQWITTRPEDTYAPVFTKNFSVANKVKSARLYISGLGLYEAHLNGEKVGNEVLTPYFSHYASEVEYQTFDITDMLKNDNALLVYLGSGWYKSRYSLSWQENNYGDSYHLIYEIHLNYEDGSTEVVSSDETTTYGQSYITFDGIYDGEIQDLNLAEAESSAIPAMLSEDTRVLSAKLTDRYSIPVLEQQRREPVELIKTPKGEYVIDFGQNMAGYVEVRHNLAKGQTLKLDFGEVLQEGNFYDMNYRSAESTFTVISDGKEATSKPHFTFYGFRYVKVDGLSEAPNLDDFKAVVLYSNLESTGTVKTGDPKINKLISNALWSQKSNFINLPMDCPQRDERLGWTGDILAYTPTATYTMDTYAFLRKFLHELRLVQVERGGMVPVAIPDDGIAKDNMRVSAGWSDVATFMPLTLYHYYGDENILKEHYPLMRDWVDYIARLDREQDQDYIWDFSDHYGDWLSMSGVEVDLGIPEDDYNYYLATCYWAKSAQNVAEAAAILGNTKDEQTYQALHDRIVEALHQHYFGQDGSLNLDTQTAYLIALDFDLCPDRDLIVQKLKDRLKKDDYRITGGFIGGSRIVQILADNGLAKEATQILCNEECPSWLYEVNLGATTMWERWDALDKEGKMVDYWLGSLNHFAYGSVVEALYANYAGLKSSAPGFKEVTVAPIFAPELGAVALNYDSPAGTYRVAWNLEDAHHATVELEVPSGASARLVLPGQQALVFEAGVHTTSVEINQAAAG